MDQHNFEQMPDDISKVILYQLDIKSILRFCSVEKKNNDILFNKYFWQQYLIQNWDINYYGVKSWTETELSKILPISNNLYFDFIKLIIDGKDITIDLCSEDSDIKLIPMKIYFNDTIKDIFERYQKIILNKQLRGNGTLNIFFKDMDDDNCYNSISFGVSGNLYLRHYEHTKSIDSINFYFLIDYNKEKLFYRYMYMRDSRESDFNTLFKTNLILVPGPIIYNRDSEVFPDRYIRLDAKYNFKYFLLS
jgi:hypothetical protein